MSGEHVIVVGGGLAGLAAGFTLLELGQRVTVAESARLGGAAITEAQDGFLFERGAHAMALPADGSAARLLEAARVDMVDPVPRGRRRLLWDGRRLVPMAPGGLARMLGGLGTLRLMLDPLLPGRRPDGETVADFVRRRLGERAVALLAQPMVTGIYAGDAGELGAADAFPELVALEGKFGGLLAGALGRRGKRPRVCAPRGGFGEMAEMLAAGIAARGGVVKLGCEVTGVRIGDATGAGKIEVEWGGGRDVVDAVIVTATAPVAARLLAEVAPAAARVAREMPSAPITTVGLGYAAGAARAPDAYGFIALDPAALGALACVFESSVFPGRAPEGATMLRVMIGGRREPAAAGLPDGALIERARAALARALDLQVAPVVTFVGRHPVGLPQYLPGHLARVAEARAVLPPGVELAGQVWDGVGAARALAGGVAAAQRVHAMLAT